MARVWKYTIYALLIALFVMTRQQRKDINDLLLRVERLENGECLIDVEDDYGWYQED